MDEAATRLAPLALRARLRTALPWTLRLPLETLRARLRLPLEALRADLRTPLEVLRARRGRLVAAPTVLGRIRWRRTAETVPVTVVSRR